jgi:ferric-dicitrate binding protein FerR (iron transport regulator)
MVERDIFHIASAYFSGRISDSDREYLNNWRIQSPENQKVFLELENIWKLTGSLEGNLNPDVDEEWQAFVKKRDNDEFKPKSIAQSFWMNPVWRISAILIPGVFLVFAAWYLFKHSYTDEWSIITAGDTKIEKTLPDGSEVWINKHSSISFPKNFDGGERQVKLTGEAFFKVTKNKGVFTVSTSNSEIEVLGTQFNVRDEVGQVTEVMVEEGKVSFAFKRNKNVNVILVAGEKGLLNASTNELKKEVSDNTNLRAWMTQKLIFKDARLNEIKVDVSKYFNKVVLVDPSVNNNTFTGTFLNPDIDEVMRVISLSINGSYEIKGDTIFVRGK